MKTSVLIATLLLGVSCKQVASQVTAGGTHTCALVENGEVLCWGGGLTVNVGQLGYGNKDTIGDDESPASAGTVDVGGVVTQIAAGDLHTCALLDTGAVRCWGDGGSGRLGYGNTNDIGDDETPNDASDINIGGLVTQIAVGFEHTCALLDTGNIRCWGNGFLGELGYGNGNNIGDDESPVDAGDINLGGIATQVVTGASHTCALLNSGTVRCWGNNGFGQLGYGNADSVGNANTPADAGDIDLGSIAKQVSAGSFHTCALLNAGAVRCWGSNLAGELGYGNTTNIGDNETPASAGDVNVGGVVTQLATGNSYTCALLDTGNVRCWGANNSGQLGYGNTEDIGDDETPASAGDVNLGKTAIQIAVGEQHTCAVLEDGAVRCWGQGFFGRLGYGNEDDIGDDETPASAGDILGF
jgi:alpha-tubulin suppressor-like RCC1 family protein